MLKLTSPLPNQVYQRNAEGRAYATFTGTCDLNTTSLDIVINPKKHGVTVTKNVKCANGVFNDTCIVQQGDYSMTVTPHTATGAQVNQIIVQNLNIGDVFVIMGHSVAQGDDRYLLGGSTDERVLTVAIDMTAGGPDESYLKSADPADLPTAIVPYAADVTPGPFGSSTHFWAKFGQAYVERFRVPVMILNAAFGGTNLEQWDKSTRGEQFEHGFCDWSKGFPYINLKNAFIKYTSVSGLRAILSDHGVNDWQNTDFDAVFHFYKNIILKARLDASAPALTVVVNQKTPYGKTGIRQATERVVREVPYCVNGPDYDLITDDADWIDSGQAHLSVPGQAKAAAAWAAALTPSVVQAMVPYQPKPVSLIVATPPPAVIDTAPDKPSVTERVKSKMSNVRFSGLWALLVAGGLLALIFGLLKRTFNSATT